MDLKEGTGAPRSILLCVTVSFQFSGREGVKGLKAEQLTER